MKSYGIYLNIQKYVSPLGLMHNHCVLMISLYLTLWSWTSYYCYEIQWINY